MFNWVINVLECLEFSRMSMISSPLWSLIGEYHNSEQGLTSAVMIVFGDHYMII